MEEASGKRRLISLNRKPPKRNLERLFCFLGQRYGLPAGAVNALRESSILSWPTRKMIMLKKIRKSDAYNEGYASVD